MQSQIVSEQILFTRGVPAVEALPNTVNQRVHASSS